MPLTISALPEATRDQLVGSLNGVLASGIDLYNALKQAHWNVKGPGFGSLHPLFGEIAGEIDDINDRVAERAVALGGVALGTVQIAAAKTTLAPYPTGLFRDLDHVKALADRLQEYRGGMRLARATADRLGDTETSNMLQDTLLLVEKRGWFLLAHIDPAASPAFPPGPGKS